MTKRIFSIAAVATLVGLAACGGGEEAAVEGEVGTDPAVVAVPVTPEPAVTVTPMPGDTMNMGTPATTPMTGDTMNMGGDTMNMGAGATTTPTP